MKIWSYLPIILLTGMALTSCGGSSSDSKDDSAAVVNADNADELSVAATVGARAAIDQDKAPTAFKPSPQASVILKLSEKLARDMSTANRTANQTIEGVCSSGSVDSQSNSDGTQFTITYNNCTIAGGLELGSSVTANGTLRYTQNSDGSFHFAYENFTITYLGETTTINMVVDCDSDGNCTYVSDFDGLDGRTYRVEGATVSTTNGYTYTVSATVYDPDYGSITISANITYGSCAAGVPESGSITYTGSGGSSGSVVYNGCDSFTVTVDGVSTEYMWADIIG